MFLHLVILKNVPWDPGSLNPNLLHVWRHLTYNFYLDTTKRQPGWFISIHFKFWVDWCSNRHKLHSFYSKLAEANTLLLILYSLYSRIKSGTYFWPLRPFVEAAAICMDCDFRLFWYSSRFYNDNLSLFGSRWYWWRFW